MHRNRSKLFAPVIVLMLTIGAISAVWLLVGRASSSREAQLQVAAMKLSLANLGVAPFNADPRAGGSPSASRVVIQSNEELLSQGLRARSQAGVSLGLLARGRASLMTIEPVVQSVYRIAVGDGGLAAGGPPVARLQQALTARSASLTRVLEAISRADVARAAQAREQTKLGAAAAMLLLLAAFAYFYLRSVAAGEAVQRLAREKEALLGVSRVEARTDALTDLSNRRALASDLASAIADARTSPELLLVMFDLDGFKQYNDSFGHAAGDALLQRLSGRLAAAPDSLGPRLPDGRR